MHCIVWAFRNDGMQYSSEEFCMLGNDSGDNKELISAACHQHFFWY